MADSKTEICNQALSHLGVGVEIADVETEKSAEARACRRFYDQARLTILRGFPWPFAKVTADLGLVEEEPNDEWAYSYRYPSTCLYFRRIVSGYRNETRQQRVPYQVGKDDQGKLIFTDEPNAVAEFTENIEDVSFFDVDFVNALAALLAGLIAPKLTNGDPFKMGERAMKMYREMIAASTATAVNEQQEDENNEAEWIRDR